jgi:thymidylate synthase ThyX
MLASVEETGLSIFERIGKAGKGMQDHGVLDEDEQKEFLRWLEFHKIITVESVKAAASQNVAKQIVNRFLEPFMHVTSIVTATDWENFIALRAHKDAQPEFQVVAYRILNEYVNHIPAISLWDDYHLPYCSQAEKNEYDPEILKWVSAARCCRVSYTKQDVSKSVEEEVAFAKEKPAIGHMSPFEHQAQAKKNFGLESCDRVV